MAGLIGLAIFIWGRRTEKMVTSAPPPETSTSDQQTLSAVPAAGQQTQTQPSAPTSPVSSSADNPEALNPQEKVQIRTLEEILSSKNDNDPRMDSDLRTFSPAVKLALQKKYSALPAEDRNGRGTILFLLARDLRTKEDLNFLAKTLDEPLCLSFENCTKPMAKGKHDDHLGNTTEVSLSYPQLVFIAQLGKYLGYPDIPLRDEVISVLRQAAHDKNPFVAAKAKEILRDLRQ